jgi:hypothetical protein
MTDPETLMRDLLPPNFLNLSGGKIRSTFTFVPTENGVLVLKKAPPEQMSLVMTSMDRCFPFSLFMESNAWSSRENLSNFLLSTRATTIPFH